MATQSYQQALEIAASLTQAERLRLIRELTGLPGSSAADEPAHSIMELCGLGKEIWSDVDAQEYVRQERMSWNG